MPTALVTTEQLTKVFRCGGKSGPDRYLTALSDCTLEVQKGEVFGLLGPNGAGKSTLLRLMLGFLKPTSGNAYVGQRNCATQSIEVRRQVSYLPGDVRLFRNMNGHRFLNFMAKLRKQANTKRSDQLAEELNLDLSRRISNMSTGMKQKLALVSSLATDTALIILDEPTSNLDPTIRKSVLDITVRLQQAGKTIVFSSHVLSEVEAICDRVAFLREGQLVHMQSMSKLKQRHRISARLKDPLPQLPELFQSAVIIRYPEDQQVEIDITGDLAQLLNWLVQANLSEMKIAPIGLSSVYEEYHSPIEFKALQPAEEDN